MQDLNRVFVIIYDLIFIAGMLFSFLGIFMPMKYYDV